jgi:hypothetical protein
VFTRKRQRKVPKVPRRDALTVLLDKAKAALEAQGSLTGPAGPWIAAANVLLTTRHSCGWDMSTTHLEIIEPYFQRNGWVWRWVGEDLVIELPGWVKHAPNTIAIQPGLFD